MQRRQDSPPLPPTTSNADSATSTLISESVNQTVGGIIRDAQTMIKSQRLRCLDNPIESPWCVMEVEPKYAESVRDALENGQIGFHTKASYNSLTSKMILHFLPSKVHDAAASSFGQMMASSLNTLLFNQPNPQYKLRGNTTFHLPNGFKEPDMYIFPVTRVREDPTLVLEVGYSERMSEWRQDAKRWLSRTPAVLLVVLIDIQKSNITGTLPTVTVEHWKKTLRHPNGDLIYSEIWPYNNNQDHHIRLDYIFETVPPPLIINDIPNDLVIPGALVDNFMNDIRNAWVAML